MDNELLTFKEWQQMWAGRTFKCTTTGETFTIPENVQQRDFFSFGDSYVDVGRMNSYCRWGGSVVEITQQSKNES